MAETNVKKRMEELYALVDYHAARYYNDDDPEISDFEYDALTRELRQLEAENPLFARADSRRRARLCRIFAWVPLGMEALKFIVLLAQGRCAPNYYPIGFCSLVIYLYPVYAHAAHAAVRRTARCIICMGMLPAVCMNTPSIRSLHSEATTCSSTESLTAMM